MPDKTINVNVDFSSEPPVWTFTGDVDPSNSQVVDIDASSDETVTWNLTTSNLTGTTLTFAQTSPIQFAGGTEDSWAAGAQPSITRVSDTQVQMTDNNLSTHNGVLVHYYRITADLNGTAIIKDPEVDEQSGLGR